MINNRVEASRRAHKTRVSLPLVVQTAVFKKQFELILRLSSFLVTYIYIYVRLLTNIGPNLSIPTRFNC